MTLLLSATALFAASTCDVRTAPRTRAEMLVAEHHYSEAIPLLSEEVKREGANRDLAHFELVHAMLLDGKTKEATRDAADWLAASKDSPWAKLATSEVQWRKGEVSEGSNTLMQAVKDGPCIAQAHSQFAKALELSGRYASARKQLDLAHKLDPVDDDIASSRSALMTRAEKAEEVSKILGKSSGISDERRKRLEQYVSQLRAPRVDECRLVSGGSTASIPFHMIRAGEEAQRAIAGLEVVFNGKPKRLEIDTGAHGLVLTQAGAASLHLKVESKIKMAGVDSVSDASVSHVDSIRIGNLEFKNCEVEVLKNSSAMEAQDGLIGGDVFSDFEVTLDFPGKALKLAPLPPFPGQPSTSGSVALETGSTDSDAPPTDRYIAPSMTAWTPVFRYDHELLMPTRLNGGPVRMFVIDSGSQMNLLSAEIARTMVKVEDQDMVYVMGIGGKRVKTFRTGPVTMDFAGMRIPAPGLYAIDTSNLSRQSGVFISGFLGVGALHQTTMQIDYRDNLVHFSYDPKRLQKCVPDMYGRYVQADCY